MCLIFFHKWTKWITFSEAFKHGAYTFQYKTCSKCGIRKERCA